MNTGKGAWLTMHWVEESEGRGGREMGRGQLAAGESRFCGGVGRAAADSDAQSTEKGKMWRKRGSAAARQRPSGKGQAGARAETPTGKRGCQDNAGRRGSAARNEEGSRRVNGANHLPALLHASLHPRSCIQTLRLCLLQVRARAAWRGLQTTLTLTMLPLVS